MGETPTLSPPKHTPYRFFLIHYPTLTMSTMPFYLSLLPFAPHDSTQQSKASRSRRRKHQESVRQERVPSFDRPGACPHRQLGVGQEPTVVCADTSFRRIDAGREGIRSADYATVAGSRMRLIACSARCGLSVGLLG